MLYLLSEDRRNISEAGIDYNQTVPFCLKRKTGKINC
jgi:hypothetical protein